MLKKMITIALASVLTFSLTACGSSESQTQTVGSTAETTTDSTVEESSAVNSTVNTTENTTENTTVEETKTVESTETESTEMAQDLQTQEVQVAEETNGKILVAYFSWSGNTQQLAEMIQSETGADLFEIVPETAYTEDYNTLLDVAQQEKSDNARPALASHVDNWADYDTIFVGYPNWWSDAPRVILTFLEEYDCTGKTIVPFCTSGGGGFGSSRSSIESSAAGAVIADGFHVGGSSVGSASGDVAAWIEGLQLAE